MKPEDLTSYASWEYVRDHGAELNKQDFKKLFPLFEPGPGPALAAKYGKNNNLATNAGTGQEAIGQRIVIQGKVTDEAGKPVSQAFIEIWQANTAGSMCINCIPEMRL